MALSGFAGRGRELACSVGMDRPGMYHVSPGDLVAINRDRVDILLALAASLDVSLWMGVVWGVDDTGMFSSHVGHSCSVATLRRCDDTVPLEEG